MALMRVAFLAALCTAATLSAAPPGILAAPHHPPAFAVISDAHADVSGRTLAPGERAAVDILSIAFAGDPTGLFVFVATPSTLDWSRADNTSLHCYVLADVLSATNRVGYVQWTWDRRAGSDVPTSTLRWAADSVGAGSSNWATPAVTAETWPHEFSIQESDPPGFGFASEARQLVERGDALANVYAACRRDGILDPARGAASATLLSDVGRSNATHDLEVLRIRSQSAAPAARPDHALGAAVGIAVLIMALGALVKTIAGALPAWLLSPRKTLASHPLRTKILCSLREHPGECTAALARRIGSNRGTLLHHLHRLRRAGLVHSDRRGRETLWVCAQGVATYPASLRAGVRGEILRLLAGRPTLSLRELAAALGRSKSGVHHHVRTLVHAGALRVEVGREGRCYSVAGASPS